MLAVERLDGRRHDRARFSCGEPALDRYLRELASQHQRNGVSTTHVLVDPSNRSAILGYYSLSAAQVLLSDLSEGDRRRLPRYPVSAARIGRLAVASASQGRGHGAHLLAHAVERCLQLRGELGIAVIVVDALHEQAARFYRAYGFRETAADAMTLYLPLGSA